MLEINESPKSVSQLTLLKEDIRNMLNRFLPPDLKQRPNNKVLSVGCGFAPEATVIEEMMPDVYFEGIDIAGSMIEGARAVNPKVPIGNFRQADAVDPASFGLDLWDLIILRNPQIRGQGSALKREGIIDESWQKILRNSATRLQKGGYMYVTAPEREEIRDSVNALSSNGVNILIPSTPLGDLNLKSNFPNREEYAALLRKP